MNKETQMMLVPQGSIEAYIRAANEYPMLTAEEEKSLAERLYYDGDIEAAKKLVLSHLRFVIHVARGYSGYGLPQADLIQEGNIGLMKAVKRFNPEVGVRLVSFAVHWIKAEIHEYVLRNWRIVKVATTKAQRKLFFNLRSSKQRLGWLSNEEAKSMADELGVTTAEVYEMEKRLSANDVTFDLSPDQDDDEGAFAPSQYLAAESADPAETLEAEEWDTYTRDRFQSALNGLDARSKDILAQRWLAEEKATLQDLADKYKVSAERIRQLENAAVNKLKAAVLEAA